MKLILPLAFASLAAMSCDNAGTDSNAADRKDASNTGEKTEKANTDYKPAFEGQTRVAAVQTSAPYKGTVITEKLNSPWGIAALPDGRLLITEKKGDMRIVAPSGGTVSDKISGVGKVDDKGQGGLLGLALDPDFASNRMVYWVFSEKVDKGNHKGGQGQPYCCGQRQAVR